MARPKDDDWVPLAVVGRPHGVRGEVRAHSFNKDSALLLQLDEVLVRFAEGERKGEEHEVSIDSARQGNDAILLKLHAVDSRDAADGVRGAQLLAKRGEFPALEDGEFYACDVVGTDAIIDGKVVGRIAGFTSYPSVDILLVETPTGRYEVPLVDPYVEGVDANGAMVLKTLEGLDHVPLK